MHISKWVQWIGLSSFLVWMVACDEEKAAVTPPATDTLDTAQVYLKTYTPAGSFTADQLRLLAQLYGYSNYQPLIAYGVDIYKISYRTTYRDDTITASGLVTVPQGLQQKAPLMAGLHGTLSRHDQAPSNADNIDSRTGLELFSAFGFITAIPDYLGFGTSDHILHPYYDYLHTSQTTVDMLYAVEELLEKEAIPYRKDLFITGYSEGGYAALATLRYIEEKKLDFTVKATAAGAGGYDITALMQSILSNNEYPRAAYLAYVIHAYNQANGWNRPLTDFFREPYASQIPALFDGSLDISSINQQLPAMLDQLFNPSFLTGIREGTEKQFMEAIQANSVSDWAPRSPVRLYHEQDDEIIPIVNSKSTYDAMITRGAAEVYYFPFNEATSHGSGTQVMYQMVAPWFSSIREE